MTGVLKKLLTLMFLWWFSSASWALESVNAIDQAVVQAVRDSASIEHTISEVTQSNLSLADLRTLSLAMTAYEQQVALLANGIRLTLDVVQQPEYAQLLDDSTKLTQQLVAMSDDLVSLAAQMQQSGAEQYQNTFETLIRTTLRLSDDIGIMADRILFTEEQIGIMADRIGEMADRILETQRIQNENIARVQQTCNALLAEPAVGGVTGSTSSLGF